MRPWGRAGVRVLPASRSPWRPELSPSPTSKSRGGARKGAASAQTPEAAAFEKEFPGASWLSAQVFRNLEVVGGHAEALIASVARRHGLSHAALNALAVIEGNGAPMAARRCQCADAHHERNHDQRARHLGAQRIRQTAHRFQRPPPSPRRRHT